MPWKPLPRIAFAIAISPFQPSSPADLPLELGDELYIIEQGGKDGSWYRGYLVAPPCLLAGLTSVKGQTLEARVFSGIFPRCCVEVREELGETVDHQSHPGVDAGASPEMDQPAPAERGSGNWTPGRVDSRRSLELMASRRPGPSRDPRLHRPASDLAQRNSSPQSPVTPDDLQARDHDHNAKPPAPVPMLKIGDETPTSEREPLVDEVSSCLREWHSTNLHQLLLNRQYVALNKMSTIVSQLDLARRQLLHNVLTAQERDLIREQTTWNLVKGNKMMSGDVIVRDPAARGRLLTGDDSAMEMTKLQAVMSLLDSRPLTHAEGPALHHLLLEIKAVTGADLNWVQITVGLARKEDDDSFSPLSETFALDVSSSESLANMARSSKLKTLFADLSAADIGDLGQAASQQIYLIIKVQESQAPRLRATVKSRSNMAEGAIPGKSQSGSSSPITDSQKAGRRSLMFGPKWSRAGSREAIPSTADGKVTPQSEERAGGSAEKGRSEAPTLRNANSGPPVLRTIGVGLLDVGEILRQDDELEQTISIWSPAQIDEEEDEARHTLDKKIVSILPSATGRYVRSHKVSSVHLHISPFVAADADALVRTNPTAMHMVTHTQKIGFSEAPKKPRSDIYLTLSEATIPREALLSHPETGLMPISGGSAMRNLQLTLEVRDGSGKLIDHCIYPSSNSPGITAWRTTVTEVGTRWSQTICLRIAKDQVPDSHLIMSVADAPEFPFALSWMPLWNRQAFLKDGPHSLLMHAYDNTTSSVTRGKVAYLSLPWDAVEKHATSNHESVTGPMATVSLESYLCSTEYSQDQVILGLVNWRQQSSDQLMGLLKKIVFVPEIEIAKQLSDVFDALFGILVHKSGHADYEDLVFTDLVAVLGIVQDRRFNLGPLVDQYAEHRFDFPLVTSCLMRSYTRLLQNATASDQARHLRAAVKVGQHLLKFIIIAREKQKLREEGPGTTGMQKNFAREVQSIFRALEHLMKNPAPVLVGSKTLVVQHFHTWLPELLAAFPQGEVANLAIRFIDACQDVKGRLILYKIILILNLSQLDELFPPVGAARGVLVEHILAWLSPYWGRVTQVTEQWRDQVRLCCSVVAELLRHRRAIFYDFMPKIVASFCALTATQRLTEKTQLSLLFGKTYPFNSRPVQGKQIFDEALLELAALMSSITKISPPSASIKLPDQELPAYILSILEAWKSVLDYKAYPASWLSLHIYHHRSTMLALEYIYSLLARFFLPPLERGEDFDIELWKAFFTTLLTLVGSDALALETFPEQRRRAVWKIAGDVREQGADLLRRSWEAVGWETSPDDLRRYGLQRFGGYQVPYVPSLVCPIMELCLSVHEGVRHVAVDVLRTMIVSEWTQRDHLGYVETEMIASLDLIFKSKTINESITQKTFIGELLDLFQPIANLPGDALYVALRELVTTIDELMNLLVAAHGDSVESGLHTLRLMEFMKDMQEEDIFIRYVHELSRMQDEARNPTESGLALQSHADLYAWDSTKMLRAIGSPAFPEQDSFQRKETLYFRMIERYEEGQAWSLALGCYHELAYHYEHTIFDFAKLARAQRSVAKIHESIATHDKQYSRFFRVHYRGLGFPHSIRDKQYVFECSPHERVGTFTDRMQKQYPNASVAQSAAAHNTEGQHLQISPVSPFRDLSHPIYLRSRVPLPTREHLLVSMPRQFSVTSKRSSIGTGVKEQFVEKTVYTTSEPFPNLLRKSEILATEEVRLTALQTGVERAWRKTADLVRLEKRARADEDPANGALTDGLRQLLDLDAANGTCLADYRELLAPVAEASIEEEATADVDSENDENENEPSGEPLHHALRIALSDHAAVIRRCLALYTRPSLQSTRNDLTTLFERAYPRDARAATPPPRSGHGGSAVEYSLSASENRSRRNSGDGANRFGGNLSAERPMSAMMSKLSSDIVNQLRDADPRGSTSSSGPHADGRRSRGDRSSQRLSMGIFKNTKGTLTPERPRHPGGPRNETTWPPPPPPPPRSLIAELDAQPHSVSLRGGWIDSKRDDGVGTPYPTNGIANHTTPLQSSTVTTLTEENVSKVGLVDEGQAGTRHAHHGERDTRKTFATETRPRHNRDEATVNGKARSPQGKFQGESGAGIESTTTHSLRPNSPPKPPTSTTESSDDFGQRLTAGLGASISTMRFADDEKKSRTANDHGGARLITAPTMSNGGDTGNMDARAGGRGKRSSFLNKWPRTKKEEVLVKSKAMKSGRKFGSRRAKHGREVSVVEE